MTNNAPFEVLSTIRSEALALAEQGLTYATQSAGVKNIAYVVNGVNYYCDAQDVKEVSTCDNLMICLLYTSPSPRDQRGSRMPSSA